MHADADADAEIFRLRALVRDLIALSAIPAAWSGREPRAVAAGLADTLIGLLEVDFAFVRLRDPTAANAVEVTRGNAWQAFPQWLERHLARNGQLSGKEIIPDVGDGEEPCCGVAIPIGVNSEGGVLAVASHRSDFPSEVDQLLLSLAANHAATANAIARAELVASRARIVAAADEARRKIERNLHDGTQQRLIALNLQLQAVRATVPAEQWQLRTQLERIEHEILAVFEDIRGLSQGLYPALLAEAGLGSAVKALARRSPIPVDFQFDIGRRPPKAIEIAAYYVVSEALTNAAKHSGATRIDITLATSADRLHVSIQDNGVGGVDPGKGTGLIGLTDRVESLGGQLALEAPHGHGTRITVDVPLASFQAEDTRAIGVATETRLGD
jgi:signal transduction histidine kinase